MSDPFALTGNDTTALRKSYWQKQDAAREAGNHEAYHVWREAAEMLTKARDTAYDRRKAKRATRRTKQTVTP